jgi:hypothetical protein
MKVELIDHRSPHLGTVKALGKANAVTLGFLPEGAFEEYASRRNVIVAINPEGKCVGYCLFRVSSHQARG